MKKYMRFLAVLVFVFGFFISSINSAHAQSLPVGCTSDTGFSPVTGEPCGSPGSPIVLDRVIRVGMRGADVKLIQGFLKEEGYYLGRIDGVYGKKTARNVKEFQDDNDIPTTGNIDAITLAKINEIITGGEDPGSYLTITTPSELPVATVGVPYSIYFNSNDDAAVKHYWYLKNPSASPLTVFKDIQWGSDCSTSVCGPFTATPKKAGTYTFTVQLVVDNLKTSKDFTLTVNKLPEVPGVKNPTIISVLPEGCNSFSGWSSVSGESCQNNRQSAKIGDTVFFYGTNMSPEKKNYSIYAVTYSNTTGERITIPTVPVSSNLLKFVVPSSAGTGQHGVFLQKTDDDVFTSNIVNLDFISAQAAIAVTLSLDPATPISATLPAGAANVPLIAFRISDTRGNFTLSSFGFNADGAETPFLQNLRLWDGATGVLVGDLTSDDTGSYYSFVTPGINMYEGTTKIFVLKADIKSSISKTTSFAIMMSSIGYGQSTDLTGFPITGNTMKVVASVTPPINGICSPTHYMCNTGTSILQSEDPTHYAWACQGSNGGTTPSCTENKILPVSGVCGTAHYTCSVGNSILNSQDSTHFAWACSGSNGGVTPSCSEQKVLSTTPALCDPMTAGNAVRSCRNYVEYPAVSKSDSASCLSYCVSQGSNACEWYSQTGECFAEFGSGCSLEGGYGGWYSSVDSCRAPVASVKKPLPLMANVLSSLDSPKKTKPAQVRDLALSNGTKSETYHFTRYMDVGSFGDEVMELQKALAAKGYYKGKIDHTFGLAVKEALMKFQADNKLKADGIFGYEVRTLLNK
jgi:peptidoglycan hydrolase-like protein with peptidoglycan-binding domain